MMKKINAKGFGALEILLIVVLIGLIGAVGYYVYSSQKKTNSALDNASKSQAEPQKAEKKSQTSAPTVKPDPNAGYLVFKEWGVKMKLSPDIADAYYDVNSEVPSGTSAMNLRVKSLDSEDNCRTATFSIVGLLKVDKNTPATYPSGEPMNKTSAEVFGSDGTIIDSNLYYAKGAQYGCTQNKSNDEKLGKVRAAFIEAARHLEKVTQ